MAFPGGSSGKRRRVEEPDQAAMLQTHFFLPPVIVTKGYTSFFARTDAQTNRARKMHDERELRAEQARLAARDDARAVERHQRVHDEMGRVAERRAERRARDGAEGFPVGMAGSGEEGELSVEEEAMQRVDEEMRVKAEEEERAAAAVIAEDQNGLKSTIVIHPGSRMLKMGRATDPLPIQIPNCLYRRKRRSPAADSAGRDAGVAQVSADGQHPVSATADLGTNNEKVKEITTVLRDGLRDRMRVTKLRLPIGGPAAVLGTVRNYNRTQGERPTVVPARNDPLHIEWLEDYSAEWINVDEETTVPDDAPYVLKHPIARRTFNTEAYNTEASGVESLLTDVECILRYGLTKLKVPTAPAALATHSVLLIVSDHCDKGYIEGMITILIDRMGFKQIAIQQESLCATFGSGLSSACVVDIGATKTTVACVDEGFVLPETRHLLNYGGDDITAYYTYLLKDSEFPYKECDLTRAYDWALMDGLKVAACTLLDNLVASNVWKFGVRRKGHDTLEYSYQTYDHHVLGPSALFEPRAADVTSKPSLCNHKPLRAYDEENMAELKDDSMTVAMELSTAHLRPPPPVPYVDPEWVPPYGVDEASGQPLPESEGLAPPVPPMIFPPPAVIDPAQVIYDSSCMPLETAVCSSLLAAEGKGPALGSAILVLGGTALIQGLPAALKWRVASIWDQRQPTIPSNIDVLPPPRGLDPRVVTWRGGTVIARLEIMQDMWIKRGEWEDIGMRAYKQRVY